MGTFQLTTPVVFIIFNRPATTERVFSAIRAAKPPELLIIADGPRSRESGESEKCAAARAVVEKVDWDCKVLKNYAAVNFGCGKRLASGLDWVFSQVAEAIILEDDCLPHPSFFPYCQELLARYRDDERVMTISGNNFQFGRRRTADSYYFSRYAHIWGWATWRRVWRYYDYGMKLWPRFRDERRLTDIFAGLGTVDGQLQAIAGREAVRYWHYAFEHTYTGKIDTWDIQLIFACWQQNGLNILPNVNLVTNIGFDDQATHTRQPGSKFANLPVAAMKFPLCHPPFMVGDVWADTYTQINNYGWPEGTSLD